MIRRLIDRIAREPVLGFVAINQRQISREAS